MHCLPTIFVCLLCMGCNPPEDSGNTTPEDTALPEDGIAMAAVTTVSSDYSVGAFATVSVADRVVQDDWFVVAGDAVVAADDGKVIQLNRYNYDTARLYDAGQWDAPVWERDLGELTNPQDAVICNGDLFVSLYGTDWMGVYDVDSGDLIGTVDLSEYADSDDVGPEPAALVEVGDKLYVGLNRLLRGEGWTDAGGMVVEIDCASRSTERSWSVGANTFIHAWPGREQLLVTAGAHGEMSGGLYSIDLPSGELSMVVENEKGRAFGSVAAWEDRAIAVAMAEDYSSFFIHCIDLALGVSDLMESTDSYLTSAVSNQDGEAWITAANSWIDPGAPSGIFVFDIPSCTAEIDAPLDFSFAPNSVAFY